MKKEENIIINQNLRLLSIVVILFLGFVIQDALGQTNEADLVVMVGDVDNLGYGFPEGFDVFSGKSTPVHGYPFKPEADDPPGTDRIMVGTGLKNNADGYSGTTTRPDNLPQSIDIQYNLDGIQVKSAAIQIFADDFQSSLWKSKFQVTLNGQRALFLEDVLNSLLQTGPVGKLITVQIPSEFLSQVTSGRLTIYIDDPTTGAGDGYSVDFVRLLVNPRFSQVGKVSGKVTNAKTGLPLSGAKVSAAGTITGQTGNDGIYVLNGVPAGLAVVTASKSGYTSRSLSTDLEEGGSATLDFSLGPAPPGEQTTTQTAGTGNPWDTPTGQNCFEKWITEAMSRLNAYDGDSEFNARKQWSINKYGILEGNPQYGPTSVYAPDNFAQYNNNRYWWMWDHYPEETAWSDPNWRGANVPLLRDYIRKCAGATGQQSPSGTGTSSSQPPFGTAEPAPVDRMTLQAGQRRVVSGNLVYVPAWLIKGTDVANIDFTIAYNPNVARPEGKLIKGNLLDNALFESNTGENGIIRAAFALKSGVSGTGTVAYIPFRAVGQPGTQTILDVEITSINNPDGTILAIERIDGSIQIVGPGEESQGDCDGDGILTAADALCALQMSVKLISERMALDMNADRQVTSRDSVMILQRRLSEIIV